jgi:Sulfatase
VKSPKLLRLPVFPFLLPIFFVFHGYTENAGYISLRNCAGLLLAYLCVAGLLFFMFRLLYKNAIKAALALVALQAVSFFFGPAQDFIAHYAAFLNKYTILLPVLAVLLIGWMIWLKRTDRTMNTTVTFINVLLLIYLFFDGVRVLSGSSKHKQQLTLTTPFYQIPRCDSCRHPDVYFLLMDEYASTASLAKCWHYDNSSLDSFLLENRFHILTQSHSNYNFTPFSMASILNMSYIAGLPDNRRVTVYDYSACDQLIQNSSVIKQFAADGYAIINYSIFDLNDNPSSVNLHFLPLKANRISGQTLWSRLRRDIRINMTALPLKAIKDQTYQMLDDNLRFIEAVEKQCRTASLRPRFIYAHLEMPHYPHFYDKTGRLKEPAELTRDIDSYLEYLPYTNQKIKEMVTAIRQNTGDSAVIILMGDHGVRYPLANDPGHLHDFENLDAVYFPDRDYSGLCDSISGVNQFRVVFNKLFRQKLPILRDSVIFLQDSP